MLKIRPQASSCHQLSHCTVFTAWCELIACYHHVSWLNIQTNLTMLKSCLKQGSVLCFHRCEPIAHYHCINISFAGVIGISRLRSSLSRYLDQHNHAENQLPSKLQLSLIITRYHYVFVGVTHTLLITITLILSLQVSLKLAISDPTGPIFRSTRLC